MRKAVITIIVFAFALPGVLLAAGCSSDADVASKNLSKAAEQFEIERRVVFFNGITDQYLLEERREIHRANLRLTGDLAGARP